MAFMKIALLAMLVYVVQANEEMKAMGKMLHTQCVEEEGTSEELIDEASKGNFIDDMKLKCYMKCLFTSTSIMEEDGKTDFDIMKAMIPPSHEELGIKMIEACKETTGPNACEKSWNLHLCFHKFSPEDYFLI